MNGAEPGLVGQVLVVGEADVREQLQRWLAARHRVSSVANLATALAAARADPPDVVVCDGMLAVGGGVSLLAEFRADPVTATTPVLLLFAEQDAADEGLAAGADDYLVKPVTAAKLVASVEAQLRLRRGRRGRRVADRDEPRLRTSDDVLAALQESLLPDSLPVLPGVRLAAHYLGAPGAGAAGGDWFDAVPLPDRRVALVVGDVVGHGVHASAAMGQLRAVLTAFLLEGHEPADALARLDRFVADIDVATASTVCVAALDPTSGQLTYTCCGHPPPLLLTADGQAHYLPSGQGVPLGTATSPPHTGRAYLAPGDVLLLYTNGLVERHDRSMAAGMEQLRAYAAGAPAHRARQQGVHLTVDQVCRLSLELMTRDGYDDDTSLIAAQRISPAPADLRVELDAIPPALAEVRSALDAWLATLGADERDRQGIQLAVGEAVTNAIEHAYRAGPAGPLVVEGYLDATGRACMTVSDQGVWRPPPRAATRGRGLIMIRACMDTVEVEPSDAGTTVLMDRRLQRAPVVAITGGSAPGRPDQPAMASEATFTTRATDVPHPRLTMAGPVDAATIERFRRAVSDAGYGGALPLELDLTAVTHLASAGVALLHGLAEQMAADRRALRLIAPPTSPARYVLQLTGLEHLVCE